MSTWKVSDIAVVSKAKTHENAKARVVQHLRTEGKESDGKLTVSCQELANVVNCTVDAARQILKGLAKEPGSGVHEVSPSIFDYRAAEVGDGRKAPDRMATFKIHEYMRAQEPYSPHTVDGVSRELGMPGGTTSGSLNRLSKDPVTGVHKDYQGVYSYRPDQIPGRAASSPPAEPSGESWGRTKAAAEARAALNGQQEDDDRPTPRLEGLALASEPLQGAEALEAAVALLRSGRSDKVFRQRAVVGGVILVEDDEGNLYPLGEKL